MSSPLLINESPLQVLPTLAVAVGLNQAIILQQLQYWLHKSSNIHEGRHWVYNTYEEWAVQLPFWSTRTIQRLFLGMEEDGLIVSGVFNTDGHDRTKWYTIDYDRLSGSSSGIVTMGVTDVDHLLLAETTTENTTESIPKKSKKTPEIVEVDEEFRERMRVKYQGILIDIDDQIDECLGYPTTLNHPNKKLTVQRWLRTNAQKLAGVVTQEATKPKTQMELLIEEDEMRKEKQRRARAEIGVS